MFTSRVGYCLILTVAVLLPIGEAARGQAMRDLIEAALDQRIAQRIEIPEQPLRDALREIEDKTGVRFVVEPTAVEWMPYGEQTRIGVTLENVSVRQALRQIFDGLGLEMRVADDAVVVAPGPALARLGRRLTADEVGLLQKLATRPWSELAGKDLPVEYRVPEGEKAVEQFEQAMRSASGPALASLESTAASFGWLWTPAQRGIAIYSIAEDVDRRLDQPIDVHYRRIPLDQLLIDLGKRIGVTVQFEPGALQRVSARERNVDLVQRDTSVRQILELVSGNTGLTYAITPTGVMINSPAASASPAGERPAEGNEVVAILRVPVGTDGTSIDYLIRAKEMPEELRQLKARRLPMIIEWARTQLEKPAEKP